MRWILPTLVCLSILSCASGNGSVATSSGAVTLRSVNSPSAGTCAFEFDVVNTGGSEVGWTSASIRFEDEIGNVYHQTVDAAALVSRASSPFLPARGSTRFSFSERLAETGLTPPARGTVVLTGVVQALPISPTVFSLDVDCDSF